MYDYMKSLQQQFESKPEYIQDLKTEVNQTHKELSARLSKEDRRLLLKLVDLEDALRGEATLHSFVSGDQDVLDAADDPGLDQIRPVGRDLDGHIRGLDLKTFIIDDILRMQIRFKAKYFIVIHAELCQMLLGNAA